MGFDEARTARFFRIEDLLPVVVAPSSALATGVSGYDPNGDAQTSSAASGVDLLRAVNQRLVLATLRAHGLAEEAEAARAQASLSERRYGALVDSMAAIVWSADASGWIRFDPRWHVLTGLPAEAEPSPADWLGGVHAGDRERVRAAWTAAVAGGTRYECEHRLYRRHGSTVWVEARAVPIFGEGHAVLEWTGLMADISARKIVDEARERFVGVLGHDLRTPLTAIRIGVDSLSSSLELPVAYQPTLSLIRRCTTRMQRMIIDVLDFTRGRLGGGIPVNLRSASFGDACRDAVNELRTVHPERRIVLDVVGDLSGLWDVGRVQQLVSNLVGNALEHGGDPVRVQVSGEPDDVVLEIQNANVGPPLPPELLPLLFEPFRRGRRAVDSSGLGLGLYIVSEIVRAHGGTIVVTSSAEGGTMFTSRWPRRPSPTSHPVHASQATTAEPARYPDTPRGSP